MEEYIRQKRERYATTAKRSLKAGLFCTIVSTVAAYSATVDMMEGKSFASFEAALTVLAGCLAVLCFACFVVFTQAQM
ncbi:MAG: hypothetical protein FJ044_04935 [Candidatus Cloacimonetes bacterium]|nr:hypothetical protein [Candidatus Cloacimonadota bacterium]